MEKEKKGNHKLNMTMSSDWKLRRKIRKHNINKAIELITKNNAKKKHRVIEAAKDKKMDLYCNTLYNNKKTKRLCLVAFSKSLALSEMQSYVARQDWKHMLNLLLKLLGYPIEVEPLVWKYAFIILLHANDPSYLHQFFEQCIGSRNLSNSTLLKRLLLLRSKKEENN